MRPSARDWRAASGHALLNWLLDLACLAACAHAVGLTGVGTTALLAAYVAGMAASGLSLLPGGIGSSTQRWSSAWSPAEPRDRGAVGGRPLPHDQPGRRRRRGLGRARCVPPSVT